MYDGWAENVQEIGRRAQQAQALKSRTFSFNRDRRPEGAAFEEEQLLEQLAKSWGPGRARSLRDRPGRCRRRACPRCADAEVGGGESASDRGSCPPTMRFYRPEGKWHAKYRATYGVADWPSFSGENLNGHADRLTRTLGVRSDIEPGLAVEVAANEVCDLIQPGLDRDAEEKGATAYGEWAAELLFSNTWIAGVYPIRNGSVDSGALAGEAERGDVIIEGAGKHATVWRNLGLREHPWWQQHPVACPVVLP